MYAAATLHLELNKLANLLEFRYLVIHVVNISQLNQFYRLLED